MWPRFHFQNLKYLYQIHIVLHLARVINLYQFLDVLEDKKFCQMYK
jgi:hypothetical protein